MSPSSHVSSITVSYDLRSRLAQESIVAMLEPKPMLVRTSIPLSPTKQPAININEVQKQAKKSEHCK
jgi:hypothetical protein